MADVGVGGCRGGMGQLGGGDGPHRLARRLGQLEQGGHRLAVVAGAVVDALVAVGVLAGRDGLVSLLMAITSLFILTPVV